MDEQCDLKSAFRRRRGHLRKFPHHPRRRTWHRNVYLRLRQARSSRLEYQSECSPSRSKFWIDPDLPKNVAPYKFHQPPTITANGVYQFHSGTGTRLEINVDAPSGMDYV